MKTSIKKRETCRAHVASDYVTDGGRRVFIFTPVNANNKSVAVVELNEAGEVVGSRSVAGLQDKAAALHRWARLWMARSIPVMVK